jgi:hypothetical protein
MLFNIMSNVSIYLTEQQKQMLEMLLAKQGQRTEERINRSTLIGNLIEREIERLELAEMIADAAEIDNLNLGWNEGEQSCQITDMEVFG